MKKALRITVVAWLIPAIAGCAGGTGDGPTMTDPAGPATMNAGILYYDTVPGEDAVTTAGDSTRDERGGGSYGSGH